MNAQNIGSQILVGIVILMVGGLGGLIRSWISELLAAQRLTQESCAKINVSLADMSGTLGQLQQWQTLHEKSDDERHEEVKANHEALWSRIDRLPHTNQKGA